MPEYCHVCQPPVRVIRASTTRKDVLLDAEPHPAGLYVVSVRNGWFRAYKIARDESPGTASRHRLHIHRNEGTAA